MLAVSNTSPLRYFVSAGHVDVLAKLFDVVMIPTGVAEELADKGAPLLVRQWIADPPEWLRIHSLCSSPDAELTGALDRGETEAIQLTLEQKADVLIKEQTS